ncbi:hypothetical protein [Prosthecobacter sp.]|jgi:hypothetical protein|uniref:hypothetical protein n=1 Tax=Prosthecobacter sp. TaxID=1965333 RepID=UPI0037831A50
MILSSSQLRRAAALQEKIEGLQQELAHLLAGSSKSSAASTPAGEKPAKKKRIMSAAARKKIADAQRKRWAKQKGEPPAAEKKAK